MAQKAAQAGVALDLVRRRWTGTGWREHGRSDSPIFGSLMRPNRVVVGLVLADQVFHDKSSARLPPEREEATPMNMWKSEVRTISFQRTAVVVTSLCLLLFGMTGCEPDVKTVEKTSDQAKLSKIAVEAKDWGVREAAVRKLTDQGVLESVATGDKNVYVRRAAGKKLTSQTVLAKIAGGDKDDEVRYDAVEKLTDQAVLAKIVMEDEMEHIRNAAWQRLSDPTELAKLAMTEKRNDFREDHFRLPALEKIADPTVLAKIAVEAKGFTVRRAAVAKLTDQAALAKIAVEDTESSIRRVAVAKLTDQAALAKFAVEDTESSIRRTAREKLTDQALLAKTVLESRNFSDSTDFIEKLSDQPWLVKIAVEAKDSAVRRHAYYKLGNDRTLAELCETSIDPATRAHASILLKIRKACHPALPLPGDSIPAKRQIELSGAIFDIVTALTDPVIATELGDVDDVSAEYITTIGQKYGWGEMGFWVKGEAITVSVKLGKKGQIVSHCWRSKFSHLEEAGTVQIYAEIELHEFFSHICELLSEPVLAKIATDGNKLPSLRSAAVEKLMHFRKAAVEKIDDNSVNRENAEKGSVLSEQQRHPECANSIVPFRFQAALR